MGDKLAAAGVMPKTLQKVILRIVDLVGDLKQADSEALEFDRLFS